MRTGKVLPWLPIILVLIVGLVIVVLLLLPRPHPRHAVATLPNLPATSRTQWEARFIPPGITSAHWTQTTTKVAKDHSKLNWTVYYEGFYKSPDHFRLSVHYYGKSAKVDEVERPKQ